MILASTVEQTSNGIIIQADRTDVVWILWMPGSSRFLLKPLLEEAQRFLAGVLQMCDEDTFV